MVEAAQILGCSAASIKVAGADDEATLARVALALKPVVERAEKLDINLLISPNDGLTSKPERVTELLKKVGGFRIGTYPDFEVASKAKDPVAYLHRLTPYATAVCAVTVKLLSEVVPLPRAAKPGSKRTAVAPSAIPGTGPGGTKGGVPTEEADIEEANAEVGDVVDDGEEDLEDAELDELERLIDEALDESDEPPPLVALKHEPYDLASLVSAIANVGFDGPLSLEYRGTGDLTLALTQSRDTFLALLAYAKRPGGR